MRGRLENVPYRTARSRTAESALDEPYVGDFDITGRPMKGWVMVEADGIDTDEEVNGWIQRSVEFVSTLPKK